MAQFEFQAPADTSAWESPWDLGNAEQVIEDFQSACAEALPTDWAHYAIRLFDAHQKQYVQFPFGQREYLKQIYNCGRRRVLLCFGRQCEKCVHELSKITTLDGEHKVAGDVRVGDRVASMDGNGHIVPGTVSAVYHNGRLPFVRMKTTRGNVAEITRSHGVLTPDGMRPCGVLTLGNPVMAKSEDKIRMRNRVDETFICSVDDIGEYEALDFEVLPEHNFLVDGVVTHNSSTLSNMAFTYCCLYPSFKVLYVAPTDPHITRFSKDRLSDTLAISPKLNMFTNKALGANVREKAFVNMSRIILRSCYLKPDSVRGIPADMLMVDEVSSIIRDHIPVMEECLAHSPYKLRLFAGTPTTIDASLGFYWLRSSQNEWAVPCFRHIPAHYNILSERNIGKHCLVCDRCGEPIDAWDEKAQWTAMYKDQDWESFRVPQIMVPSVEWSEILHKQRNYSTQKFKNEVMADFADEGSRPVTRRDLMDCCLDGVEMSSEEYLAYCQSLSSSHPVFMGMDWGSGDRSYTVMSLGSYLGTDTFTIFYLKRFEGPEADPVRQLQLIETWAQRYNVHIMGVDYGYGFVQNETLKQHFGGDRMVMEFYYSSNPKKKFAFSKGTNRFILHRSQMLSNLFSIIKSRKIGFPRWSDFEKPFAQDILNVSAVYNPNLRMITYEHPEDLPDDTLHSILYCFLASFREFPRQDLLGQRSIPTI